MQDKISTEYKLCTLLNIYKFTQVHVHVHVQYTFNVEFVLVHFDYRNFSKQHDKFD